MALLTVDAVKDAVAKTKVERSLRYYLEHIVWPVIEPQTEFQQLLITAIFGGQKCTVQSKSFQDSCQIVFT